MTRTIAWLLALMCFGTTCWSGPMEDCSGDGSHDLVIKACSSILEKNPKNPNAAFYRGLAHALAKELDQAIADFSIAISNYPRNADAAPIYVNRGNAYFDARDFASAEKDLDTAIELEPNEPTNYRNRGNIYTAMKKFEAAIADHTKAIELGVFESFHSRGYAYFMRGGPGSPDNKLAIEDFTKSLEKLPKFTLSYLMRARSHMQLGELDEAATDYNKLIEVDPNSPNAPLAKEGLEEIAKLRK